MKRTIVICAWLIATSFSLFAQQKKYPSLLWEITGNDLHQPSYLFGTMHVSSKMVFHLSDSFYYAIKNVDMVALEQNPLYWQRDMMQIDENEQKIKTYMHNGASNYLNEKSFQLEKYEDDIKAALTDEPQVVNGLLYRNYEAQEDYEENTYLDLYIYQTGRKLGKKAAGVEDYYQTERIVFEAYQDAMKDKNKKERNTNGESIYDIEKKIQAAYRQGDLDMLDSLEKYEYTSTAFLEKFLYKRNEIQAHSIDTIVKHNSLFVGVGAAHLPGKRGVIELLRKMGYHLRPIGMQDRNAERKDEIDKMKVPVQFREVKTDDGFVSAKLPGTLYKRNNAGVQNKNESWQYADMENGAYYTVIRVKTNAALLGISLKEVEQQTDSLLYENIPGKIIAKSMSYQDVYPVIDVTNRTRRGDLQRYRIIITPFEEVVCKMSSNNDYVSGEEGETFFKSIHVAYHPQQPQSYTSRAGGFSVMFPQLPYSTMNTGSDNIMRTEWEAVDTTTGNAYTVWKKTVNNYRFLEEDTFDLSLIEESMKRSEMINKEVSRSFTLQDNFHALNMIFLLKNGNTLSAKAILRGAQYYLMMCVARKKDDKATAFINSFKLNKFLYANTQTYTDTALHFTANTSVVPQLDSFLMNIVKASSESRYWQQLQMHTSYLNNNKTAFFQDDSTGEAILVSSTVYPKYFYSKDSASFWKEAIDTDLYHSFIVKTKERYKVDDKCSGYKIVLQDTNTVRQITMLYLLKQNHLFQVTALSDTVQKESSFVQTFLSGFRPESDITGESVFKDKQEAFFSDYKSKDSAIHNEADDALADVKFTCKALPQLQKIISSFAYGDKNYFEDKSKFIHELGYINEPGCMAETEKLLSQLYRQTADTAFFQNEILSALARLKIANAYDTLQALLLQDPPVFDDENDYDNLFELMYDSLSLTRRMFPGLLQLSSIENYKMPVNNLLLALVDSGLIQAADYESYFSRLYFDAKIEMKKMQNSDERLLQNENNQEDNVVSLPRSSYHFSYPHVSSSSGELSIYSALLMPFYDSKTSVPLFFQKQLTSKNPAVQLEAAIALAKHNKQVPDSIWRSLAAKDKYRVLLLKRLKEIKRKDLFPSTASNQEAIAKSVLLNDKGEDQFQSLQLVSKELVSIKGEKGYVYFFKYKMNKEDDWKIGISGLQPVNTKEVNDNAEVTRMTGKNLSADKPETEQFEEQLKQLLFSLHESAYSFFIDDQYYSYHQNFSFGN